jgi:plastocyanin
MTADRRIAARLAAAGIAGTLVAALAGGAWAAESPAPSAAAPGASGGNAISIVEKAFQPADLTIHAGDTVTWTITKAIGDPHSVTSGTYKDAKPGTEFDSGIKLKADGDTFSHTFAAAGTFAYFCAVHPDVMTGTITVVGADGAAGGEGHGTIDTTTKLVAAAVLAVAIVLMFLWARVYRRMNPAP